MATKQRKKTGDTSGDKGGSAKVIDIPHEEVKQEPGAVSVTPKIITTEDQIKLELAKFSLPDSAIAQMKDNYGALVINGNDDKEGYKAVKEAWNDTRSRRTGLEKKGLELRNGYTVITKAIKKEEDRLIELLTPLETELHGKWKAIDDDKDRIKREKEEAEQRQAMVRVEEVLNLGMTMRDGFYCVGDDISMDVATLRALPDDQYDKLKEKVKAKVAEIKEAEDKERQRKQEEAEELKRQQDKLKEEQDKLRQQQEDMQRQQKQLDEQKEQAEKAKKELRTSRLLNLGMTYAQHADLFEFDNGFKSVTHDGATLFGMDDYGFDEHFKVIAGLIKESVDGKEQHDQEVARERQAIEEKKKFIAKAMETAGLAFSYTAQSFQWEDKNTAIEAKFAELLPLSEADITIKANDLAGEISAAKKLTKDADEKADKDRQAQEKLAMGDKDRYTHEMKAIADASLKMVPGEFKTKKYQQRSQQFLERLSNLLNEFE